jgi:hypothetical protein
MTVWRRHRSCLVPLETMRSDTERARSRLATRICHDRSRSQGGMFGGVDVPRLEAGQSRPAGRSRLLGRAQSWQLCVLRSMLSRDQLTAPSRRSAADPQSSVPKIRSLSVMATVPFSWPPAGCWWPPTLDGGEGRRKTEQPGRAGCSRSLAEASSCSPADGSSYNEVANHGDGRSTVQPVSAQNGA